MAENAHAAVSDEDGGRMKVVYLARLVAENAGLTCCPRATPMAVFAHHSSGVGRGVTLDG